MTLKNGTKQHKLTAAEARKGGRNSGKTRAAKRTIKKIIEEIVDGNAYTSPQFTKLATKLGVGKTTTVKELFTLVCIMNTLKSADIDDAEKLAALLGEQTGEGQNNGILDELGKWLKDANT